VQEQYKIGADPVPHASKNLAVQRCREDRGQRLKPCQGPKT